MRELLISNHFLIITDVPDLKRNSIKTSHTFTRLMSLASKYASNNQSPIVKHQAHREVSLIEYKSRNT